jgi:hypothetical protein
MWASEIGYKDIVEYLVTKGADKEAKSNVSTKSDMDVPAQTLIHMYVDIYTYIDIWICSRINV